MRGLPPSRRSSNKKATARRAASAAKRQTAIAGDPVPVEAVLQRNRVSAAMQVRYLALVRAFQLTYALGDKSAAALVDRALNTELVRMYLLGEEVAPNRMLLYAVKWFYLLTQSEMRNSLASLKGHLNLSRENMELPETWEAVCLQTAALVRSIVRAALDPDLVYAAAAFLLQFDTYSRLGELLAAQVTELRAPAPHQRGMAACWTLTLHPCTEAGRSKTKQQDDTITIGSTCPRRAWLTKVAAALATRTSGPLLPLTEPRHRALFHRSRQLAGLQVSHPHRLRHGGASADGAAQLPEATIQARGRWVHAKSVQRYKKPARYLRELAKLTPQQMRSAIEEAAYLEATLPALIASLAPKVSGRKRRKI